MIIEPLKRYPLSYKIAILLLLTIFHFLLAKLGLLVALTSTNASSIWPASGYALAAVLIFGHWSALAIFLGSWLAEFLFFTSQFPSESLFKILGTGLFIGAGAALQAIVGAALIHRYIVLSEAFQKPFVMFKLLLLAAISCLVNANIGMFMLCLSNLVPWSMFLQGSFIWWFGDIGGIFVITPLLLAWLHIHERKPFKNSIFEVIGLIGVIAFTIFLNLKFQAHFFYLFFPCLVWAAIRFQFKGVTATLLITFTVIILETSHNLGSFVRSTPNESFFAISILIVVMSPTMLLMAAELVHRATTPILWKGSPHTIPRYTFRLKEFLISLFKPRNDN